jgi:hypothetical protein
LALFPKDYVLGGDTLVYTDSIDYDIMNSLLDRMNLENAIILIGYQKFFPEYINTTYSALNSTNRTSLINNIT